MTRTVNLRPGQDYTLQIMKSLSGTGHLYFNIIDAECNAFPQNLTCADLYSNGAIIDTSDNIVFTANTANTYLVFYSTCEASAGNSVRFDSVRLLDNYSITCTPSNTPTITPTFLATSTPWTDCGGFTDGFEATCAQWSKVGTEGEDWTCPTTDVVRTGDYAAELMGCNGYLYRSFRVVPGHSYTAAVWVYGTFTGGNRGGDGVSITGELSDSEVNACPESLPETYLGSSIVDEWTQMTIATNHVVANSVLCCYLRLTGGADYLYLDDLTIVDNGVNTCTPTNTPTATPTSTDTPTSTPTETPG